MDFTLIENITKEHFKGMMNRIPLFLTPPRNMEGWFSGEMAVVLEICKAANIISEWWPEVRYSWNQENGRKVCDYVLQVEGDPLPLVGLEIKTAFAARQGKRSLIQDEAGVIMLSEEAQEDRTLWRLQNAYYYKSVAEDAKRLSKQGGVGDRYCLVFAYGKNGELSDGDVEEFKDKLIFCCPEVARQESFHVRLEHNQENVITVLRILAFCVSSQDDVDNDR